MPQCKNCTTEFAITDADRTFYARIDVPAPTWCPRCREVRRMVFRNERHLYHRACDKCTKEFLSIYRSDVLFPVYCYDCWWGDQWNAAEYAQEYQSNIPFFEQVKMLWDAVPRLGIVTGACVNCDYANYTNYSKNCYLVFGCHAAEDSYYDWRVHDSQECVDCAQVDKSEGCYECVDCDGCYGLLFSQDCSHCNSSAFLYDCKGCQDCLFCAGLRNAQHCIFNKKYSPEAYAAERAKVYLGSRTEVLAAQEKFDAFLLSYPRRATVVTSVSDVSGDHISYSKNVYQGFHCKNVQDGAYLESCEDLQDAWDSTFAGWPATLNYEGISAGCVNSYNVKFSSVVWSCSDVEYSDSCHHSKNLFGCCGFRHGAQYYILNKQYDEVEWQELRKKIIANMMERGEYGEFFPLHLSPFAYNETVAYDFYPRTKEEVQSAGLHWRDDDVKNQQAGHQDVPADIREVSSTICQAVLTCTVCAKGYKVIPQELALYKKMQLPVPRVCFHCRHQARMQRRGSRKLWERTCNRCQAPIKTTYAPDRPEKVYCEECYQKEIY